MADDSEVLRRVYFATFACLAPFDRKVNAKAARRRKRIRIPCAVSHVLKFTAAFHVSFIASTAVVEDN